MNTQDKLKVKDKRPGRFIVDDAVVDILGDYIGAYGLAVYMALTRYADRHGDCYPSLRTLSRKLGVSRPTVVKTYAFTGGRLSSEWSSRAMALRQFCR